MLWEAAWGPKVELVLRQSEFAVISLRQYAGVSFQGSRLV